MDIEQLLSRDLAGYRIERWCALFHWWEELGRGHDSSVIGYFSSEEAANNHPDKPRHGSKAYTQPAYVLTTDGKEGFLLDPTRKYRKVTRLD
jgi:hypothetical protein